MDSLEKINKENNKLLREKFGNKIKGNFLIEILYIVLKKINFEVTHYFDMTFNYKAAILAENESVNLEICRTIIGIHRSNCIFLSDEERTKNERDPKYKQKLVDETILHIKIRRYSAVFFRKKQIVEGDEFLFFPFLYKLYSLCIKANYIIGKNINDKVVFQFYSSIFNKSLAALTLIECNFLDNAYPICRLIIELYIKMLILEIYPNLLDEHEKFTQYDFMKTCCGNKYPEEFLVKFRNRKNQSQKNRIDFLHYGWIDSVDEYHEIVRNNKPYSLLGLIEFLKEKTEIADQLEILDFYYKMCHSYTHGNVNIAKYPLLNFFELSIILGFTLLNSYALLCNRTGESLDIEGYEIYKLAMNDLEDIILKHNKRSEENFASFYKK